MAEHGTLRAQLAREWRGIFPLPLEVATFYELVGPVDIFVRGYGNPTEFPRLANLWEFQAGYRWNSITGELSRDWSDDWLVVASEGGDPYIFDRASREILIADHGQGVWEPRKCFPNLPVMASCLAALGSIARKAGKEFLDAEFYVRAEHRRTAIAAISGITGSAIAAEEVVSRVGW